MGWTSPIRPPLHLNHLYSRSIGDTENICQQPRCLTIGDWRNPSPSAASDGFAENAEAILAEISADSMARRLNGAAVGRGSRGKGPRSLAERPRTGFIGVFMITCGGGKRYHRRNRATGAKLHRGWASRDEGVAEKVDWPVRPARGNTGRGAATRVCRGKTRSTIASRLCSVRFNGSGAATRVSRKIVSVSGRAQPTPAAAVWRLL